MRRLLVSSVFAALALGVVSYAVLAGEPGAARAPLGKLRHVVLFKFKEGTSAEDIKKIEDAFRALPKKVPQIVGFEWGTNCSVEPFSQGFTHCFLVTFNDAEGRAAYLPHPAHKAFGKLLGPHLDKVLVVDYVVQQ